MSERLVNAGLTMVTLLAVMAAMGACTPAGPVTVVERPRLFADAERPEGAVVPDDPTIVRLRYVNVNFEELAGVGGPSEAEAGTAEALALNLFKDASFIAILDHIEHQGPGRFAWVGCLQGVEQSEAILTVSHGVMDASIVSPGSLYRVDHVADGVHVIYQIDQPAAHLEDEPTSIPLYGGPAISLSPVSHHFGSVETGTTTAPQAFAVSNTGAADVVIKAVAVEGTDASDFTILNDKCSSQSVSPSESCSVDLVFSPTDAGEKIAALVVSPGNSERSTVEAALMGTGVDLTAACEELRDKPFERLEIGDMIVYFHQRTIDEAIVEKDYIVCQFDRVTKELLEKKVQWRAGLPYHVTPMVSRDEAESMVPGEVQFSELYIISPDSDVFPLEPAPENPCWVVRSIDGDRIIVTIIDALTGEVLGEGVPPAPAARDAQQGP